MQVPVQIANPLGAARVIDVPGVGTATGETCVEGSIPVTPVELELARLAATCAAGIEAHAPGAVKGDPVGTPQVLTCPAVGTASGQAQ